MIVAVPDFPSIVAVAVVVPGATAVTSPVVDTVAIAALAMDQLVVRPLNVFPFPSFGVAVSCWVAPTVSDGDAGVTSTVATAAGAGGVGVVGVVGVLGVVSEPPPHADARTSSGSSKTCQRMERTGIIGREKVRGKLRPPVPSRQQAGTTQTLQVETASRSDVMPSRAGMNSCASTPSKPLFAITLAIAG